MCFILNYLTYPWPQRSLNCGLWQNSKAIKIPRGGCITQNPPFFMYHSPCTLIFNTHFSFRGQSISPCLIPRYFSFLNIFTKYQKQNVSTITKLLVLPCYYYGLGCYLACKIRLIFIFQYLRIAISAYTTDWALPLRNIHFMIKFIETTRFLSFVVQHWNHNIYIIVFINKSSRISDITV